VPETDPNTVEQHTYRLRRLEEKYTDLENRISTERAARQLLQRDVRWILRVSMGAAAVVSFLISIAAQYLAAIF
jgi:hypothetical protein